MPIQGKTDYTLLRDVVGTITVYNRQTGQVYANGTDYTVSSAGHLVIPDTTQIPKVPANWTSTPIAGWPWTANRADGSAIRLSSDYQYHQIAVTYEGKPLAYTMPPSTPGLQKLMAKLNSGQSVAITFVGDSITYGADSTWEMNANPRQRGYAYQVVQHLAALYPGHVYYRDRAVSGTTMGYGAYYAASTVADTASDAVVIAWGMNDAGIQTPEASFETSLRQVVAAARTANPDCEILDVLSWPSNPELSPQNWGPFGWYYTAAGNVAGNTPGFVVANVTSPAWDYILARKSFYDVTANGVNHPSDWMASVYAQIVLRAIFGTS
ncbi:MAG: SGNH/GDSL hydrolase family protein [Pseudomonadota bacterium]